MLRNINKRQLCIVFDHHGLRFFLSWQKNLMPKYSFSWTLCTWKLSVIGYIEDKIKWLLLIHTAVWKRNVAWVASFLLTRSLIPSLLTFLPSGKATTIRLHKLDHIEMNRSIKWCRLHWSCYSEVSPFSKAVKPSSTRHGFTTFT